MQAQYHDQRMLQVLLQHEQQLQMQLEHAHISDVRRERIAQKVSGIEILCS